jgi:hypothetical protein
MAGQMSFVTVAQTGSIMAAMHSVMTHAVSMAGEPVSADSTVRVKRVA